MRTEDKLWRTLIRVTRVNPYNDEVSFVIPGWNSTETIILQMTAFPVDLRPFLKKDYRCYVKVNIGCENKKELKFEDWEWEFKL